MRRAGRTALLLHPAQARVQGRGGPRQRRGCSRKWHGRGAGQVVGGKVRSEGSEDGTAAAPAFKELP